MNKIIYHKETIKGHTFRLRYLSSDTFNMGSNNTKDAFGKEDPIHQVELSEYYIAEFPVTQALWRAVMREDPEELYFKGDKRPVERVSWYDIVGNKVENTKGFLHFINQQTATTRPEGYQYRLPTEAQWEYAAKAKSSFEYSGSDKLKEVGWYDLNSHRETKEVGLKAANDFGLFDMSGNVWEWCWDWRSDKYYQECFDKGIVKDPTGPPSGTNRVIRGGAWGNAPRYCRVAYRDFNHPAYRNNYLGFRLVLSLQFKM